MVIIIKIFVVIGRLCCQKYSGKSNHKKFFYCLIFYYTTCTLHDMEKKSKFRVVMLSLLYIQMRVQLYGKLQISRFVLFHNSYHKKYKIAQKFKCNCMKKNCLKLITRFFLFPTRQSFRYIFAN